MKSSRLFWNSPRVAAWAAIAAVSSFFLAAGSVEAAVVPVLTPVADPPSTPFLSPAAGLGSDWVSFQLGVQGAPGEHVRAVDVRVYGQLHQRWVDTDADGVPDPTTNGSAANGRGDSHFTLPTNALTAVGPSENNFGSGSPLADTPGSIDHGVGSELRAVWGLPGPAVTSANLAYVVIPRDSSLKYSIQVADGDGNIYPGINSDCAGLVCAAPNLDVIGNHHDIVNGDLTPSVLDDTDFGAVVQGSSLWKTFTLSSAGTGELVLGTPTITGPFSLGRQWESKIPQSMSVDMILQLNTSVHGTHAGSISFTTNDPLAPTYTIALSAQVMPEPTSAALLGMAALGLLVGVRRRG
jgi:MYXO-CTERM domain-containing protein